MKANRMIAGVVALAGASCISTQAPDPRWPKERPLKAMSQLNGVYRNESDDGRSLYDLLNGNLGTSNAKGRAVELRVAPDEKSVALRLRDGRGKVIESCLLRSGDDFILDDKRLSVKVPSSIGLTGTTNLGAFAGSGSVTVSPSESGGLLGHQSESGIGLLFYMVPFAGADEERYYWPADR